MLFLLHLQTEVLEIIRQRFINTNLQNFFTTTEVEREAVRIYYNIEEKDVKLVIYDIDANSAADPDGFSATFLNLCKRVFAKALHLLFQSFLTNGKLTGKTEEGIICPIHTGGSRTEAKTIGLSLWFHTLAKSWNEQSERN